MRKRSEGAQRARAEKRSVADERFQVACEKQRLERLAKEAPEINETLRAVAVEAARSIHMSKRLMAHHLAEDVNTDAAELLASAKYGAPLRPAPPAVALAHRPCVPRPCPRSAQGGGAQLRGHDSKYSAPLCY